MNTYARLLRSVLDHPRRVLWCSLVLALAIVAGLPALRIYIELDPLLPEDSEITQTIRTAKRLFGPTDYIVIGLTHKTGRALDREGAQKLGQLHDVLRGLPNVSAADITSLLSSRAKVVESVAGEVRITPILRNVQAYEGAEDRARRSGIYRNLLSADGRSSLILLRISEPKEGKLAYIRALKAKLKAIEHPHFSIFLGGQPTVFSELERYSQNVFLVMPLTLLLIGLIHFEAFRSLQGFALPLVTAVLSAAAATACMNVAGIKLDGFNATAQLVIIALTAGHAVQMLKRYNEDFLIAASSISPGSAEWRKASRLAIESSFVSIAPVMMAASLVAMASFGSLIVFKTPAIQVYGIYVAIGILAGLLIELFLIPALRLWMVPKRLPHVQTRSTPWDRVVEACAWCASPAVRGRTIAVSAALLVGLGVMATQVKVDNSVEEYFARFTDIRKAERTLNQEFAGSNVLYVLLKGQGESSIATARTANLIREIQSWLAARPGIGAAVSYVDAAAEVGCGFEAAYCRPGALSWQDDALRQFLHIYEAGAGVGVLDDFITPSHDSAVIRVLARTDSSLFVDDLFRELRTTFDSKLPDGVLLSLGGTGATTLALNRKFIEAKLLNIVQILGIAALISAVLFRSALMGLLVALPLFVATLFDFAVMTVTGIPLNVATIFIAAISVGIGADYAIYFGTRLREFLRIYPDDEARAVRAAYETAGKAALFVACAVAGGYLGLIASIGYNVHLWLGLLVSAAMLASVAASLTLFPALLLALKPAAVFEGLRK